MGRWLRLGVTFLAVLGLVLLLVIVATSGGAPAIDPIPPIAMVPPQS